MLTPQPSSSDASGESVQPVDPMVSAIMSDHNYAKPWRWRPDANYAKPVRSLFTLTKGAANKMMVADITVDVETVDSPHKFQPSSLSPHTSEWVAAAEDVQGFRVEEKDNDDGDWEAKVQKTSWTVEHARLFNNVVKAVHEAHMAQLALNGRPNEAVQKKLAIDTAARRVRRAMASATWDIRLTHWLHNLLLDHLPASIFAVYLEILRVLRIKAPSLVEHMVTFTPDSKVAPTLASEKVLRILRKDSVETAANQLKPRRLPLDAILITVPSGIGRHVGHASRRNNNWVKQLSHLGQVACVDTRAASLPGHSTVESLLGHLLGSTRAKIEEVKVKYPGRPIVLIGWNVGAGIAVQAALMESVNAVICLGFPISTLAGRRGQADDCLLDITCPILFVIGQNAPTARQADIEDLRERLKVQSGLIVIGSADEHLRVTSVKKRSEGLTQSMIDRCILDEVGDFLASVLTQPLAPPASPKSVAQKHPLALGSPTIGEPEAKKSRYTPKTALGNDQFARSPANKMKPFPELPIKQSPTLSRPSALKAPSQKLTPAKPGITVNIGSLASLGPIGPIRLGNSRPSNIPAIPRPPTTIRGTTPATLMSGLTPLSSLMVPATSISKSEVSRQVQVVGTANLAANSRVKYVNKVTTTQVARVVTGVRPAQAPGTPR
ncbi:KAT8 regulatory NSL complex subunit 3 [Neocloeon triangulifer]|uniref:KAT8 regulatory NSL complex subunit 3 n=1 Tax=Neocloeon triangulifer TaxID=2078957 RepID=UPI00286EF552|nr:KAT8 regulatory NSL complex subunit 3 [Neocloeon triangulifer]